MIYPYFFPFFSASARENGTWLSIDLIPCSHHTHTRALGGGRLFTKGGIVGKLFKAPRPALPFNNDVCAQLVYRCAGAGLTPAPCSILHPRTEDYGKTKNDKIKRGGLSFCPILTWCSAHTDTRNTDKQFMFQRPLFVFKFGNSKRIVLVIQCVVATVVWVVQWAVNDVRLEENGCCRFFLNYSIR